jgi:hypothetical protein
MASGLSPPSSSRRRAETGFRLKRFASRSCVNLIKCTRNHPIPPGSAIAFPLLPEMHFTALAAMPCQGVALSSCEGSKAGTVCGTTKSAGGSEGTTVAPARETTAEVITPSPGPSESFLRSDHRQNTQIATTMVAIITGTNSRRSSLAGIRFPLSNPGHVFAGIGFEIANDSYRERGFSVDRLPVLQEHDLGAGSRWSRKYPASCAMTLSVWRADALRSLRKRLPKGTGKTLIQAQAKETVPARGSWDRSLEVPGGRRPTRFLM